MSVVMGDCECNEHDPGEDEGDHDDTSDEAGAFHKTNFVKGTKQVSMAGNQEKYSNGCSGDTHEDGIQIGSKKREVEI